MAAMWHLRSLRPPPRPRARSGIASPPNEPNIVQASDSDELANASEINAKLIQLYRLDNKSAKREPYTIVRNFQRGQPQGNQCVQCKTPSLNEPVTDRCRHPTSEEWRLFHIECETTYYRKLLEDGAQPVYPIVLLNAVSRDPRSHGHLLRYFQRDDEGFYCVFKRQWARWKEFRTWQLQMREGHKHAWHIYSKATAERLKELNYHGPISIQWEPQDMDQLSTWLEYWSYEFTQYGQYSWYREPAIQFDKYDRHWQILLWASVLQPCDRRAFIETADYKQVRERRKQQAKETFEAASSRLLIAQRDELHPDFQGEDKVEEKRLKTQHKEQMAYALEDAHDVYQKILRWDEAIENYCFQTTQYRIARRQGQKQESYLTWISSQIPRIRARMIRARDGVLPSTAPSRTSPPFDTTPFFGKRKFSDEFNTAAVQHPIRWFKPGKRRCSRCVEDGHPLVEPLPHFVRSWRTRGAGSPCTGRLSTCSEF
ncbi:hypothetical protein BGZ63DRAFT_421376 [Mariannaea sp. PMI_226]|nr:hypothetical protein BGZ63DRAFT_421376 [Mariannaea sp. PMI_226]